MSPSVRIWTSTDRPVGSSRLSATFPLTMSATCVGRFSYSQREVHGPCRRIAMARASSSRCGGWSVLSRGDEAIAFMRLDSSRMILLWPNQRSRHIRSVLRRACARSRSE